MIRVGTKVKIDSLYGVTLDKYNYRKPTFQSGTITYINKPHRWFLVEYITKEGIKLHRGYKFDELNSDHVQVIH